MGSCLYHMPTGNDQDQLPKAVMTEEQQHSLLRPTLMRSTADNKQQKGKEKWNRKGEGRRRVRDEAR